MFHTSQSPSSPPNPKAKPRRHARWLKIIAQCKTSGLSEQAFCDSIGVKLDTFRKHRYQAGKASGKKVASGFKPVQVVKPEWLIPKQLLEGFGTVL